MLAYYLRLALTSLKRNRTLSMLMILAIAIGIGVCMTTLTVYTMMSGDPIPEKSTELFSVRLDSWDPNEPWDEPNEPPPEMTYRDAMALMQSDIPVHQSAMYKGAFSIEPANKAIPPYLSFARISFRDFFPMFNLRFLYGGPWDASADKSLAQVVVLAKHTNDKLFGGEDSVGKTLRIADRDFKVIGVVDTFNPLPKFYDVNNGAFDDEEDIYLPWGLTVPLEVRTAGNTNSWKNEDIDSFAAFLNSEQVWIQFWAELKDADMKQRYQTFLDSYTLEQKKLGRFPRPLNNRLSDVTHYMDERHVVREDNRVLVGLSFMFLAVCLINMVGLLLAKFLGKSPELALRRALGASQGQIVLMSLVEVGIIGLFGGLLGLILAFGGLRAVRWLYGGAYEHLAQLNLGLTVEAILIAIAASILAGLYPAFKVGRLAPAGLLKTQ